MKLDAYSRTIRAPRGMLVVWLRLDAELYAKLGKHAEARYLLALARHHAAIVIGNGCEVQQ